MKKFDKEFKPIRLNNLGVVLEVKGDALGKFLKKALKQYGKDIVGEDKLHKHNSIPGYTASLDDGCVTCIKNKSRENIRKRSKDRWGIKI